jgi:hypothetical protein
MTGGLAQRRGRPGGAPARGARRTGLDGADDRRGGFTKTIRWLGILLPMVLSYPLLPVDAFGGWFRPRVLAAAAVWLVLAAVLLIRRDWRGAAAITAVYVIVDAWWLLPATGVVDFD